MERSPSGRKINTVCGQIDISELGFTLMHEHIIVDPQNSDSKYDRYRLLDSDRMCEETEEFVRCGGRSILDAAPLNFGRDVEKMEYISQKSGCNIMFSTGFHKQEFLPDDIAEKSVEDLMNMILDEIEKGVGVNSRRPAVIKFGTSLNTITEQEEKCIEAVCRVHRMMGLPVITHTEKGTAGLMQIEMMKRFDTDLENVIIGHVDLDPDIDYYRQMLDQGANIQFDHFGRGDLNEDEKLDLLKELIEEGYTDQLFISGDMGKIDYLPSYGGRPGFRYFCTDLKDKFAQRISMEIYEHIMTDNVYNFFKRQSHE